VPASLSRSEACSTTHDNYITNNPLITSAGTPSSAPDLHLQSTSPLIGAGITNEALNSVDYTGATRPNPPSIGAYDVSSGGGGSDAGSDTGGGGGGSATIAQAVTRS